MVIVTGSDYPLVEYLGRTGEAGSDEVGGFAVSTGEPGRVDLERGGSAAAVAEAACDGTQVDSAGEEVVQQRKMGQDEMKGIVDEFILDED